MKKINILFVIDNLLVFGGTEKHLYQVITGLDRHRFSCTVCPLCSNNQIIQRFRGAGTVVQPLDLDRIYGIKALRRVMQLANMIRRNEVDIVQTFYHDADLLGLLAAKLAGAPLAVSSRRDMGYYKGRCYLVLGRVANRTVDHFIAVCDAVAQNVVAVERVPGDKITTIYNGVDTRKFSDAPAYSVEKWRAQLGIGADSFVVGNVSHFRPEKGYNMFFEAIKILRPIIDNLKIVVVGGGPYINYFEKRCREEGFIKDVIFTGYVEDTSRYISIMDVACLTAVENEGFSNAILEEMACGKPVIATSVGGSPEAVLHGQTGYIIPPNNPQALADAILRLYKNPILRRSMGAQARKRVEGFFTIEQMINNMEEFYTSIINRRQR